MELLLRCGRLESNLCNLVCQQAKLRYEAMASDCLGGTRPQCCNELQPRLHIVPISCKARQPGQKNA